MGVKHRNNSDETGQVRFTVYELISHEEYNSENFNNDIAVIHIPEVHITPTVQVILIAHDGDINYEGLVGIVSGWGRTSDTSVLSYELMHVKVPVISNESCELTYGSVVIDSTICTTTASCSGDSGGPLAINGVLVGVVSFGSAITCANFPTAFARVSYYKEWISRVTNGNV